MSEATVFPRGTKVKFLGFTTQQGVVFRPGNSYIWGYLQFPDAIRYLIEHPEGFPKSEFMDPQLGTEGLKYLDGNLQEGKKYMFCFENDIEVIPPVAPPSTVEGPPDLSDLPD